MNQAEFNLQQLNIIHNGLSAMLIELRDNPSDKSNPEIYETMCWLMETTKQALLKSKSIELPKEGG